MAAECRMDRNYSMLLLQTVRYGHKRTQVALFGQQNCSVHESYCSIQPHTARGGLQLPGVCV